MKTLLLSFIALVSFGANAFTLISQTAETYKDSNEIIINVASDGCSTGPSAEALLDLAMKAAEAYWNSVETANIQFKEGKVVAATAAGQDFSNFVDEARQVGINTVIIGCSTNMSATAAAVGGSGGADKARYGAVLMKDVAVNFNRGEEITMAILAHELGHVLGLGHSRHGLALMDSSGGAVGLNKLTQDDRDGATYLYPYGKSPSGCFNSLLSIDDISRPSDKKKDFLYSMLIGFILLITMKYLVQLFFSYYRNHGILMRKAHS
ncbi:MAG: hypothetical protein CME70_22720 [Halobacteriovorax sp.]|nr:hypothetical protein [Halobacteriovorax sp.]|tara:strand:- start:33328 stop:34122 length:795 start_codon:yes stop_codon:yes gene_type:complete